MKWVDDLISLDWENISRLLAIPGTAIGYFMGKKRAHLGDLKSEIQKLEVRLNNYRDRACNYLLSLPSQTDQTNSTLLVFDFHNIVQEIIFLYEEYEVFDRIKLLKHNKIIARIAVDEKSNYEQENRKKAELVSKILNSYIRHLKKEFRRKGRFFLGLSFDTPE